MKRIKKWTLLSWFPLGTVILASAISLAGTTDYYPGKPAELRQSIALKSSERAQLKAGQVVTRSHSVGSPYLGGTAIMLINQPIWQVWQAVTDYPQYPEFFPRNQKSEILEKKYPRLMLKTELATGPHSNAIENESLISHYRDRNRFLMMSWEAKKSTLKENFGYWLLESRPGQTLVFYQINFLLQTVNKEFARPFASLTLERNLQAIAKRASKAKYSKPQGESLGLYFSWDFSKVGSSQSKKD